MHQTTSPAPKVVVAVALIDSEGRVLAGKRRSGRWEFPGGKVEQGETDEDALLRECREELGVEVELGERLGSDVTIERGWVLRLWTGRIVDGRPEANVHASLRWLSATDLSTVEWLTTNVPVVTTLRKILRFTGGELHS